jgi:hypothetical protein
MGTHTYIKSPQHLEILNFAGSVDEIAAAYRPDLMYRVKATLVLYSPACNCAEYTHLTNSINALRQCATCPR